MPLVPYKNKYDNYPLIVSCGKGQGFYPCTFTFCKFIALIALQYNYNV